MCKKAKFHVESCNEEDESDDEEEESDDDNRMKANLKQTENIDSNSSRRYCSIQQIYIKIFTLIKSKLFAFNSIKIFLVNIMANPFLK